MSRESLIESARETVEVCDRGGYTTINGDSIDLRENIKKTIEQSVQISGQTLIGSKQAVELNKRPFKCKNKVIVTDKTTNDAIDFWNDDNENRRIVALNFASAKNPGGGFLRGMTTQEECLARRSTLYSSLEYQMSFYNYNRNRLNRGLYNNLCIYSPNVAFIKNNYEQLVNPTYADVITCPAPNRGAALRNGVSEGEINNAMFNRIDLILSTFLSQMSREDVGNAVLIVGAFGCGVFKNKPEVAANIFKAVINNYEEQIMSMDIIIDFAIPGGANLETFKSVLGS